jgi:hypothetical protein
LDLQARTQFRMSIIGTVEGKLSEAQAFLNQMRDQEQRAFGEKQSFDHYLSAFLSAAMSARGAFHVKQDRQRNHAVKKWKETWEAQLTPEQRRIYEFMRENRNYEVHSGGSHRAVETKQIKVGVGGSYTDKSGSTLTVMGSPSPLLGANTGATISLPQYVFEICGVKRPVTEGCADYLSLLYQMLAHYKATA